MTSSGGVWAQPALGRAADVWGYAPTYLIGAAISAMACRSSPSRGASTRRRTTAASPVRA